MVLLKRWALSLLLVSGVPAGSALAEVPDIDAAVSNIRPGMRFADVKVDWVVKNCAEFFKTELPGCPVKGRIQTPFGTAHGAIIDGREGVVRFIRYTYPLDESVYQNLLTAMLRLGVPTTARNKIFETVNDEFCWFRSSLKYCLVRVSGRMPPRGPKIDEIEVYVVPDDRKGQTSH